MAMLVKLDEALSQTLVDLFDTRIYEVHTVRGQGWGGMEDSALWPMVQDEGAFLSRLTKALPTCVTTRPAPTRACCCCDRNLRVRWPTASCCRRSLQRMT
jgi:hypothetical protein